MDREQAKNEAKSRFSEYLDMITIKKGSKYICPICKSGTGKNKTPAGQLNASDFTFHCFSCNFHGDIFNLLAKIEGITSESDKFTHVYEILNIQVEQNDNKAPLRADKQPLSELSTDYTLYFQECNTKASETDYFSIRGLSKTIIDKYNLGYDPAWRSPKALKDGKNPPASSRIIIPTSKYSYLARATDKNADPKYKKL